MKLTENAWRDGIKLFREAMQAGYIDGITLPKKISFSMGKNIIIPKEVIHPGRPAPKTTKAHK